ncbi:MAG: site-specific integrase [Solirubrobacteraceae bacterium]
MTSTCTAARSSFAAAKAASVAKLEWTAGPGSSSAHGCNCAPRCQSAHCFACCADRPPADHGPPAGVRSQLHHAAARAGVRRRFAPHQLRHAHAVEMSREGVPLLVIQRQLGHADLAITSVYLRGIDNTEIVHAVHERPAPMIPATRGL